VNTLTKSDFATWKAGETLLLSGKILTGRDAAHKRLIDMLNKGENLPVDFTNRLIYYVGPVPPTHGEVVGPAGPTTSTRMDKFTRQMLPLGLLHRLQLGRQRVIGAGREGIAHLVHATDAAGARGIDPTQEIKRMSRL